MSGGLNVPNVNAVTVTANSSGFSIAGGSSASKTLTVSNTVTIAGTDSSTLNIGAGGTLQSGAFQVSSQGTTGAQGVQGTTGSQGAQGTDGVQGNTGAQGTQGLTGPNGIQGATGTQGSTGTQGATGVQGSTGTQGIQGITGSQGATGTQGAVGSTGGTGATGSTGVQGSTGAQGTSGASILGTNNTWTGTNAFTYPSGTAIISLDSTASLGTGTGLSLAWRSYSNSGNSILATTAAMRGARENATSGNYAGYFSIYTTDSGGSNLERFHINSSGNVGIGTTSPSQLLTFGNATAGLGIGWGDTSGNYANIFAPYSASGLVLATGFQGSRSSDAYTSSYGGGAMYRSGIRLNAFGNGNIQFFTDGSSTIASGSAFTPTERMRITDGGNVGIGTTSPAAQLQVGTGTDAGAGTGTGQICVSGAGSTLAVTGKPAVYHRNSVGLGLYSDYAISFEVNGGTTKKEAARIDSSGNVGIGTSDPQTYLDIYNAVNGYGGIGLKCYSTALKWYISSGISGVSIDTFAIGNNVAGTSPKLAIDSSGNVGIGTTSPTKRLCITALDSGTAALCIDAGAGFLDRGVITTHVARQTQLALVRASVGTWGFDITSGGIAVMTAQDTGTNIFAMNLTTANVGIGTITPSYKLHVAGDIYSSGTITEASSITLKENLNPITDALDVISSLQGWIYDRKDGTAMKQAGFIAEEVEQVLPNVVSKTEDGTPMGVQYTKIIAYLVESVKELKAQIEVLKK
jgi:hypothetical protein